MTAPLAIPSSEHDDYQAWLAAHHPSRADLDRMRADAGRLSIRPLISVVIPVFDPPERFLRRAIESVLEQAYQHWQLCLVDDGSRQAHVKPLLEEYAAADDRIRVAAHAANQGIAAASNTGLTLATGDFVAFLDHDDEIAPHALFAVAALVDRDPLVDVIYTDEDKIDEHGVRSGPVFKPDWCPDSFLSRMYTCHLSVYRRSLVERVGGFRERFEGGQTYDLMLRLSEATDRIRHIPDVLYHWRTHAASTSVDPLRKLYVYEADRRALQDAIDRRGEPGVVTRVPGELGAYIVRYRMAASKRVSIVTPSRDQGEMLDNCLESVFARSTYPDFEVVLVDNGTTEPRAIEVLARWRVREPGRFRVVRRDAPFNFSMLSNVGAAHATGEYLLFLNNDTEVITSDWIAAMVEQAQRPSIGAVGAMLLYNAATIQHAGAILGLGGLAAHSHRGCSSTSPGYMGQVITVNNYLSVAGTCLMVRRALFEEIGGFDERLPGDYEDVDFCLKLVERGLRNVYLPHVRLFHHEAATRGRDYVERDPQQRLDAIAFIQRNWQRYVDHDPCYNPHLTRAAEDYSLNVGAIERIEATVGQPRMARFRCAIDRLTFYDRQALRLRGSAATLDGTAATRVAVALDGRSAGDAWIHGGVFHFTMRSERPFAPRVTITLTLEGPAGDRQSCDVIARTDGRGLPAWRAADALRRTAKKVLRRGIVSVHRRCPTFTEVKGRGMRAACAGIARRAAVSAGFQPSVPLADDPAYRRWLLAHYPDARRLSSMAQELGGLTRRPTISVLLPVYDIEARYLAQAIDSVRAQVYPDWELCIADDASSEPHVRPLLERCARLDPRIRVVFRERRGHIAEASNSALALATGEFVAQLDHDDLLAPHALFEAARLIGTQPDVDYIYSDEDKVDLLNIHRDPFFKPDWSPDTLLTKMYTCHLGVYRRTLVESVGGFRPAFDGAEDYDLVLRLTERTDRIAHIPDVLYHWRLHPQSAATGARGVKRWAHAAAQRALSEALLRRGERATVVPLPGSPGFFRIRHAIDSIDRVSIVVPTRDQPALLDRCLLSIFESTTYPDFEVIVVDNGSVDPVTACTLRRWRTREPRRVRALRVDAPFNFAALCNAGAAASTGRYLLFLNDDTHVISPDWLESMVEQGQRARIGAVGAQLLYPDRTLQHAGIVLGIGGTAGHPHRGMPASAAGYVGRLSTTANVAAVTGACLMCRRETFDAIGGFDEAFDAAYNDVDLCLRMLERGFRHVYLPHVQLYHLESQSWRRVPQRDREALQARASERLRRKWGRYVKRDPYYSPHLARHDESHGLSS